MSEQDLEEIRRRIEEIDGQLIALAAERVDLARRVGEVKRAQRRPTVDFAQERRVLERGRRLADRAKLDPRVAEDLIVRLIQAAVTVQEEDSLRAAAVGEGKVAVVLGGAGRMGRWFCNFLRAQGWRVAVADPAAPADEDARARGLLPDAELVVSAAPPGATADIYRAWLADGRLPTGLVLDLASIKSPLIEPIGRLREAGARVASVHPMFGPATVLLRDCDLLMCDTGDREAGAAASALFEPTTARIVHLPLAEHDRTMADLLSLAHATAIAFALALPESSHPVKSTTFQALEALAATVVRESPDLYYEIQAGNPHSLAAVERLRAAVSTLIETIEGERPQRFRQLMEDGQRRTAPALG